MAQHSQHPVTSETSVASNADGAAHGDHALQIRTNPLSPFDFSRESFRVLEYLIAQLPVGLARPFMFLMFGHRKPGRRSNAPKI